MLSQAPLSRQELKAAFPNAVEKKEEKVHIADWLAYPHYAVRQKAAESAHFRYVIPRLRVW